MWHRLAWVTETGKTRCRDVSLARQRGQIPFAGWITRPFLVTRGPILGARSTASIKIDKGTLDRIVYVWPVLAVAFILLGNASIARWWQAFFCITLIWPIVLLARRALGTHTGAITASGLLILVAASSLGRPTHFDTQPTALRRPFDSSSQRARHSLKLPIATAGWQELWSGDRSTDAYLYFFVGSTGGHLGTPLVVWLNDTVLGRLTEDNRVTSTDSQPHVEQNWYRLAVQRGDLEKTSSTSVSLGPDPDGAYPPGSIWMVGGYNYRASLGPRPSSFFDGERWTTEPALLLLAGGVSERQTDRLRYYIDLRISEHATKRIRAIFY